MASVGRNAFGRPPAPKTERVPLPEFAETAYVCVRELSAKDLIELRKERGRDADLGDLGFVYDLLARTLCDDAGAPLFPDVVDNSGKIISTGKDDLAAAFDLPLKTLERLAAEACRIGGLRTEEKN